MEIETDRMDDPYAQSQNITNYVVANKKSHSLDSVCKQSRNSLHIWKSWHCSVSTKICPYFRELKQKYHYILSCPPTHRTQIFIKRELLSPSPLYICNTLPLQVFLQQSILNKMNLNFRQAQAGCQNQTDQIQWGKGIFHCNGLGCKRTKKQGLAYFYTILKNCSF